MARHDGTVGAGPACPPTTDFVLHISAQGPSAAEGGDSGGDTGVRRGYACTRGLEPPHPGDPGGGGGPRTITGDCVHDPAVTALYVQLGGGRPVGCARPV